MCVGWKSFEDIVNRNLARKYFEVLPIEFLSLYLLVSLLQPSTGILDIPMRQSCKRSIELFAIQLSRRTACGCSSNNFKIVQQKMNKNKIVYINFQQKFCYFQATFLNERIVWAIKFLLFFILEFFFLHDATKVIKQCLS